MNSANIFSKLLATKGRKKKVLVAVICLIQKEW